MKVVYTAPNRAHHYRYAYALKKAGCLQAFVSGFPRISPRAKAPELNGKLHHSDVLQTLYVASLKAKLPEGISRYLGYLSKIEQDLSCKKYLKGADIFLFYNGSGLTTARIAKSKGVITIVEAVNSHVECQERILEEEHRSLGIAWTPFPEKEKLRRLTECDEADFILLPSDFVKRSFLAKGFPESKLLKVPYGFNTSTNRSNHAPRTGETFTVLFVGSISVRKGIRYLIEAFHKISHPAKKLVLVGPNANDGALEGLNITDDIVFTGVLKGKDLEEAYQSADVFCLPSIEEGLALVLGEALSYGLPTIATTNTGADDIISNDEQGFIVPIRDSMAISQKLQALIDDNDLYEGVRFNAYKKSRDLNGWEETGNNLVKTLSKLVNDEEIF